MTLGLEEWHQLFWWRLYSLTKLPWLKVIDFPFWKSNWGGKAGTQVACHSLHCSLLWFYIYKPYPHLHFCMCLWPIQDFFLYNNGSGKNAVKNKSHLCDLFFEIHLDGKGCSLNSSLCFCCFVFPTGLCLIWLCFDGSATANQYSFNSPVIFHSFDFYWIFDLEWYTKSEFLCTSFRNVVLQILVCLLFSVLISRMEKSDPS